MTKEKIKEIRQEKLKLTKYELARKMGVSERTVNNWEKGKTRMPQTKVRMLKMITAEKRRMELQEKENKRKERTGEAEDERVEID